MKRVDKAKCIRNVIERCKEGSKELEMISLELVLYS